jgi:hypothetical protein
VRFLGFAEIQKAKNVRGEVAEVQRAFVIVRIAVAARVPGDGGEAAREELELRIPRAPVAADAVQEDDVRSLSRDREREPRRPGDEQRVQAYSALAPEIFTARPRLS